MTDHGSLTRWLELSADQWYAAPPQLVVFTGDPAVALEHGVTAAAAARALGGRVRVFRIGAYTVVARLPLRAGATTP